MTESAKRHRSERAFSVADITATQIEEFYCDYFLPLVRHAVRRHGLTMEDAGDVVQDAFLLALGKLDPAGNPKAWLYQVVDHLSANWRRKITRRAQLLARWEGQAKSGPEAADADESTK